MLVIEMMFFKHILSLMMCLRWPHDNLSGPGEEELQQLTIVQVNSSSKNSGHTEDEKEPSSFKIISFIVWNWAELKDEWRAC